MMPRTRIGTPNGVKLKKRKPSTPWRSSSLLTTRFGAVATSVVMPLISAAKLSGIISRPGPMPVLCAMRSATGMKMAVTAVELIVAPRPQTTIMSRTMSRISLLPAFAISQSPTIRAPVSGLRSGAPGGSMSRPKKTTTPSSPRAAYLNPRDSSAESGSPSWAVCFSAGLPRPGTCPDEAR